MKFTQEEKDFIKMTLNSYANNKFMTFEMATKMDKILEKLRGK